LVQSIILILRGNKDGIPIVFFFSMKEAKSVVLLRRRSVLTQNSAKPTGGFWGLAPKKTIHPVLYPFKRFFACRRPVHVQNFGKADTEGFRKLSESNHFAASSSRIE
jgi:hypothetical protein